MSENPLSRRYQSMAYPESAYDWNDTDHAYIGKTGPLVFNAESKVSGEKWFPTVTGRDVSISVEAVNPKSHRHSKISEHGGYKPVITEFDSQTAKEDFDSHAIYQSATGQFMDTTNAPEISSMFKDRMEDLSKERPGFPRTFNTLSRAQFVAELVAGRIMTGKPLGRRKRS